MKYILTYEGLKQSKILQYPILEEQIVNKPVVGGDKKIDPEKKSLIRALPQAQMAAQTGIWIATQYAKRVPIYKKLFSDKEMTEEEIYEVWSDAHLGVDAASLATDLCTSGLGGFWVDLVHSVELLCEIPIWVGTGRMDMAMNAGISCIFTFAAAFMPGWVGSNWPKLVDWFTNQTITKSIKDLALFVWKKLGPELIYKMVFNTARLLSLGTIDATIGIAKWLAKRDIVKSGAKAFKEYISESISKVMRSLFGDKADEVSIELTEEQLKNLPTENLDEFLDSVKPRLGDPLRYKTWWEKPARWFTINQMAKHGPEILEKLGFKEGMEYGFYYIGKEGALQGYKIIIDKITPNGVMARAFKDGRMVDMAYNAPTISGKGAKIANVTAENYTDTFFVQVLDRLRNRTIVSQYWDKIQNDLTDEASNLLMSEFKANSESMSLGIVDELYDTFHKSYPSLTKDQFIKFNSNLIDQLGDVKNYDELYKIVFGTNWKISMTSAADVAKTYIKGAKTATTTEKAAAGSGFSYNPYNSVNWSSVTKPTSDGILIPFSNFINQTIYLPANVLSTFGGIPATTASWLTFCARVIGRETFTIQPDARGKTEVKTGEKKPTDSTQTNTTKLEEEIIKTREEVETKPNPKKVSQGSQDGFKQIKEVKEDKTDGIKIDTVKLKGTLQDIQQKEDSIRKAAEDEEKRTGFKKQRVEY